MMPCGPCEDWVRTPRPVRRQFSFKALARVHGGLAQAASGRRGSACGQEIIFNKLREKHEAEAGKDGLPQPMLQSEAPGGSAGRGGVCIGLICSPLNLVPTAFVLSSVGTWGR